MSSVDLEALKVNVRAKLFDIYRKKGLDFAIGVARTVRDRDLAKILPDKDSANNCRGELCEVVAELCLIEYLEKHGKKYKIYKGLVLDDYYQTSDEFSTETDLTLVTEECVYIIECKSYYGTKTITGDCTLTTGHSVDVFKQNVLHLQSMRKLIDNQCIGGPAYKLVLFSFSQGDIIDKRTDAQKKRMQVVTEDNYSSILVGSGKRWDFDRVCKLLDKVEQTSTKSKRLKHVAYVKSKH